MIINTHIGTCTHMCTHQIGNTGQNDNREYIANYAPSTP